MNSPYFSVVICTRQREALLRDAIQSVIDQTFPRDRFEILIVDNGPSEATEKIAGEFINSGGPSLRYFPQPEPGLSRSRNKAVEWAGGSHLLFLDDDAIATAGWLSAYDAWFSQSPDSAGAGGSIVLVWEAGRPQWLRRREEGWYAALDLGTESRLMTYPESPFGANMAWNRKYLEELGGFDASMGYNAERNSLIPCEDMHLAYRIFKMGGEIGYVPQARVFHRIEKARSLPDYFVRRAHDQGVADARLRKCFSPPKPLERMGRTFLHTLGLLRAEVMLRIKPGVLYAAKRAYNLGYRGEWCGKIV